MRIRSVDPSPAQSDGEPPTCTNNPGQSGTVGRSRITLAPPTGSRLPGAEEEPSYETPKPPATRWGLQRRSDDRTPTPHSAAGPATHQSVAPGIKLHH